MRAFDDCPGKRTVSLDCCCGHKRNKNTGSKEPVFFVEGGYKLGFGGQTRKKYTVGEGL